MPAPKPFRLMSLLCALTASAQAGGMRVVRCDFAGASGHAEYFQAELDEHDELDGNFTYVVDSKKAMHFADEAVRRFVYSGKLLEFSGESKSYGTLKVRLGAKGDEKNLISWKKGKESFQVRPSVEACKVVAREDYGEE